MYDTLSIAIFLLLLCFLYAIYVSYTVESFDSAANQSAAPSPKIHILSADELSDYITSDPDHYFQRFHEEDWKVRNVSNADEYIRQIKRAPGECTFRVQLQSAIAQADQYFRTLDETTTGIHVDKLASVDWVIGIVDGDAYENGLPHTRNNVIILPRSALSMDSTALVRLLIHEKIHVYQKWFPQETEEYLHTKGFTKWRKCRAEDRVRVNPDTDGWIWKNANQQPMMCVYCTHPKSITDTVYSPGTDQASEHPFEWMAIQLERGFSK